jgi:cell division protein ZipA
MDQHWLTIIVVVVLIVGIIFDGVRRMRKARFDSLQMKLKPTKKKNTEADEPKSKPEKGFGSEFPNGGARVSSRTIDPDRIKQVRNKYNFGSDMSAWRERVVEKIAEHRGKLQPQDVDLRSDERIEPSVDADPLMDDSRSRHQQSFDASTVSSKYAYSDNDEESDSDLDDSQDESFDYELYDKADETLDNYSENIQNSLEDIKAVNNKTANNGISDTTFASTAAADIPKSKVAPLDAPVQVSLNLDHSVPMLMDTFDEQSAIKTPAREEPEVPVKTSMNPFTKQSPPKNISTHHTPQSEGRKQTWAGVSTSQVSVETKASSPKVSTPGEVLVIHVRATQDNVFNGDELLELILEHGLRFGAMDIFHRHAGEDGEGPILFSLSNMVKPGVFDLHTFDEFSTVGVSLFLALPVETDSYLEAFEAMLTTAKAITKQLQGELKDENRNVLTGQTIEHYRERIRDFSRRQRLEKRKL